MLTGSASEPVEKTRIALLRPTVISFLPLGVYAMNVGPGVSAGRVS